jgi:hypothetical protein
MKTTVGKRKNRKQLDCCSYQAIVRDKERLNRLLRFKLQGEENGEETFVSTKFMVFYIGIADYGS